jgi:hypothetical protein
LASSYTMIWKAYRQDEAHAFAMTRTPAAAPSKVVLAIQTRINTEQYIRHCGIILPTRLIP